MKTKILTTFVVLMSMSSSIFAQTLSSFADVFITPESRLDVVNSTRKVEDTAANSVTIVSFASKLVFPDNTTNVNLTSVTFTVSKRVGGVNLPPLNVSMSGSKFNDETPANGTPNIFGRTSTGTLFAPTTLNLVGNDIVIKTLYITDHLIPLGSASFPQLSANGDFYRMSRTLSGNHTVGGIVTPFSVTGESVVIVVNETTAPIGGVSQDYPNNTTIVSTAASEGVFTINANGLTVDSYLKTWWVESCIDLINWEYASNGSVGPAVIITFPIIPNEPKRFWRIRSLTMGDIIITPPT